MPDVTTVRNDFTGVRMVGNEFVGVTSAVTVAGGGGGGVGTVTSVGLSAPAVFTISGSPVTGAGTITISLATQAANLVFAGPTTGSAAAPTFRSLVAADIPSLSGVYQPLDADLTSWAAITRASGFDTFVKTPSVANFFSLVTGESPLWRGLANATSLGDLTFIRVNADDSMTMRSASDFRNDIGLGTMATESKSTYATESYVDAQIEACQPVRNVLAPTSAATMTLTITPGRDTFATWVLGHDSSINISGTSTNGDLLTIAIRGNGTDEYTYSFDTGFNIDGACTLISTGGVTLACDRHSIAVYDFVAVSGKFHLVAANELTAKP